MSRWMRTAFLIGLCISMMVPSSTRAQDALAAPAGSQETLATIPQTLAQDPMRSYAIVSPKIFWNNLIPDNCDPDSQTKSWNDAIRRVAVQGSLIRTLYLEHGEGSFCGPGITSNIVSDGNYVYFVKGSFQRLPVTANPGDPTESTAGNMGDNAELLRYDPYIFVLTEGNGLWRVNTQSFGATQLHTALQVGTSPSNFQTDGEFLYWLSGGKLREMRLSNNAIADFPPSNVTNYTLRLMVLCFIQPCSPDSRVFVGVGNTIDRYKAANHSFETNVVTGAAGDAFDEMVVSEDKLFFVQEEQTTCEPFCSYNTLLKRKQLESPAAADLIYQGSSSTLGIHTILQLKAFGGNLYWMDYSGGPDLSLKRLPENADALPLTNLRVTNIEITQAIQTLNNNVRVIDGKRTFVRVHVQSDGPAVPGVTTLLYRLNVPGGTPIGEPLRPVNPSGQYLTVWPNPDRAVLDQAFLFELPMDWVDDAVNDLIGLGLQAEVNPYKFPAQASYANNIMKVSKQFSPSGRLDIRFVLFRYVVKGVEFVPDLDVDFFQTVSWIRRAYPVASTSGFIGETSPGFRPGYTYVTDNALKDYITQKECDYDDDLCASDYVHGLLEDWDEEWNFPDAPMYGIMPYYTSPYNGDGYFPRGSTSGDTSNGPSGVPSGGWTWDVDGTYADWYAGHEIGHVLGRDHPTKNGDDDPDDGTPKGCGHTQDDDSFPYNDARIGVGDLFGFDMGNPENAAIAAPSVYPPNGAFDMMSYCHPIQWISDYTYNGLYESIINLASAQAASDNPPLATGDYLYLYGVIKPAAETAKFVRVRRKNGDYVPPAPGSTDYALRFSDAGSTVLSTVDILTTVDADQPDRRLFDVNLPFVAGARKVQIVHKPDDKVYAEHSLSPNLPQVSNVSIGGAANPVSGPITVSWTASDPDGDPLTFDVHYSRDNGATFQPIQSGLTGNSAGINTLELGGTSQAILRVTASDGSNTATAATPPFVLASKPPVVMITNPGNGATFHYGQMINFIGDAYDPQWQPIAAGDYTWSSEGGPLGTGAAISLDKLSVGEHTITFSAKNSAGLQASTSITVVIDDNLDITGPTLSVAPIQLGWHFVAGATAAQPATLFVDNVGSGSLSWTASTPAPWLSLSANAGTTPAAITVTADPTKIPAGDSISSSVIVTGTIANGQVVVGKLTVPVHAVFGNGYVLPSGGAEPGTEPGQLYLPSIGK